jgi:nicotinic acid mononucleotide adenylyltransferase
VLQNLREEYAQRLGPNAVQLILVCGSDLLDSLSPPTFHIDQQLELSSEEIESVVANYGLIVLTRPNTSPYKAIYSSDVLRKYEVIFILELCNFTRNSEEHLRHKRRGKSELIELQSTTHGN